MAEAETSGAEAAEWLEKALLDMCDDDSTAGVQLDPEVVTSLVSYCQLAPPSDAGEYLSSIFGHERSKDVVAEYLQRRGRTSSSSSQIDSYGEPLQAYLKVKTQEEWSASSKKMNKASKKKNGLMGREEDTSSTDNVHGQSADITTSSLKANRPKSRGKKGAKGVSLAEAAEGTVLFPRGGPCNCQARRHKLINNCLSCGKIVCEQEGEGPCNFCGTLVLREGSSYAGLEGGVSAISEAEAAAQAFKDRLVEYNRNSAMRTAVIDDQSDYFEIEGNSWISDKEKKLLEKKRDEVEQAELERRKRVTVTIDLLGRKVVMADHGSKDAGRGESILLGSTPCKDEEPDKVTRIKPNPYIAEIPRFVETQSSNHIGSKKQNREKAEKLMKSGRIQHNDPITEALTSRNLRGAASEFVDNSWEEQNLKDDHAFAADDGDGVECRLETMAADLRYLDGRKSAVKQPALSSEVTNDNYSYTAWNPSKDSSSKGNSPAFFDICEPCVQVEIGNRQRPMNLASPLLQKQVDRVASLGGVPGKVLHPGLVLLKNWLSMDEQINIINECQLFGKGVGGFYKPTYGDGNSMHLWMMCLGKHWEPMTSSYLDKRVNYDNATPPPIPLAFVCLVEKALLVAQSACTKDSSTRRMRSKAEQDILPSMRPDVCIVNFYERSGKLGMHQDKDESSASLARGAPVISFSIGDTAEFQYGNDRKVQNSKHLFLKSGDVLIFGGSARMIYHGVESILPGTAPSWLTSQTNLRPGRLNLTFREL